MATPPPTTEPLLQTWQEIAGYLGVSIREAQNWEKDGLPIRRMPGKRSRVFALKSDLDSWRLRVAPTKHAIRNEGGPSPTLSASGGPLQDTLPASRRSVVIATGATGVMCLGATAWLFRRTLRPSPERVLLQGGLLTTFDGTGTPVFEYRFRGVSRQLPDSELLWRVQIVDFEGNGRNNVVAAVRRDDETEELFCLSPSGVVEWTLPCRPPLVDVNGHPFEPAWRFSNIVHGSDGRGGQVLWVSIAHLTRFPGCVLRVDRHGTSRLQFANAGNVQALARLARPDGDLIIAGGVHNGFDQAFAAALGPNDAPSTSPLNSGGPSRYRFGNAPRAPCRAYLLFATSELSLVYGNPYGHVRRIGVVGEEITVEIDAPLGNSYLMYSLSSALEPRLVSPSRGYFVQHDSFRKEHRFDHSSSTCPETARPMVVRRWTPASGWSDRQAPWRVPTNTL